MSLPTPPHELYQQIFEDADRTERICALIEEIGTGWTPTIANAFSHPRLAGYYSYPGSGITSISGGDAFETRPAAFVAMRRDLDVAYKWLEYAETSGWNVDHARAIVHHRALVTHGKMVGALNHALQTYIDGEGSSLRIDEARILHGLIETTSDRILHPGVRQPLPPAPVHNHLHLGQSAPNALQQSTDFVDWQAGLTDFGAVMTVQRPLSPPLPILDGEVIAESAEDVSKT